MSVEFQPNDEIESARTRRQALIHLARRTGIESPVQAAIDAEEILDGKDKKTLRQLHGWTLGRYSTASALKMLYETAAPDSPLLRAHPETDEPVQAPELALVLLSGAQEASPVAAPHTESRQELAVRPLQISIKNLFKDFLDDDALAGLADFSPAQYDHLALEMGKIQHEHAKTSKFVNRNVSQMRRLLHGLTAADVARQDGVTEGAVYNKFSISLPKFYETHAEAVAAAFEKVSQLPPDADPLSDDDLTFMTERPAVRATPARQSRTRTPAPQRDKSAPREKVSRHADDEQASNNLDKNFSDLDSFGQYLKQIGRVALLSAVDEVELAKDIEAGLYAQSKLTWLEGERVKGFEGRRRRQPDDQQLRDLRLMARRGEQAKNHLMEANLRLVVSLAKRYTGRGMPLQDLVQEGNLGLNRAVEKFDYTKGFKFSTYATWWIRQAITRGMADQVRTIRLPVHLVEKVNKLSRVRRELQQNIGREPTYEELAEESDIPLDKIHDMLEYSRDPVSLDMPVGNDEEAPLGDFIKDDSAHSVEDAVTSLRLHDDIGKMLAMLSEREQQVIQLRFGLEDGNPRTLDDIGKLYKLSRERVRQIEREAMAKLRTGDSADSLREYLR